VTPTAYTAARRRLGLTHKTLAAALGVEPQTSRRWSMRSSAGPDRRAVIALKLIEAIGAAEARRILETR
jgi:DNA-binding transcriptional regulator YiaG